jgi:hypothetical protein
VTVHGVTFHTRRIYEKLEVHSKSGPVAGCHDARSRRGALRPGIAGPGRGAPSVTVTSKVAAGGKMKSKEAPDPAARVSLAMTVGGGGAVRTQT